MDVFSGTCVYSSPIARLSRGVWSPRVPQHRHEMALDLVYGADFGCNRHCKTNIDLVSGPSMSEKRQKNDPLATSRTPDSPLNPPKVRVSPGPWYDWGLHAGDHWWIPQIGENLENTSHHKPAQWVDNVSSHSMRATTGVEQRPKIGCIKHPRSVLKSPVPATLGPQP